MDGSSPPFDRPSVLPLMASDPVAARQVPGRPAERPVGPQKARQQAAEPAQAQRSSASRPSCAPKPSYSCYTDSSAMAAVDQGPLGRPRGTSPRRTQRSSRQPPLQPLP